MGRLAVLQRGWASVVNRSLNMFTLIAMGVGVAWIYSVVATLAPTCSRAARMMGDTVAVYFEAAAVITVLALLGQVLELRAREQTSARYARFLTGSEDSPTYPARWHRRGGGGRLYTVGDKLRVRMGEKVPVDGRCWRGVRPSMDR